MRYKHSTPWWMNKEVKGRDGDLARLCRRKINHELIDIDDMGVAPVADADLRYGNYVQQCCVYTTTIITLDNYELRDSFHSIISKIVSMITRAYERDLYYIDEDTYPRSRVMLTMEKKREIAIHLFNYLMTQYIVTWQFSDIIVDALNDFCYKSDLSVDVNEYLDDLTFSQEEATNELLNDLMEEHLVQPGYLVNMSVIGDFYDEFINEMVAELYDGDHYIYEHIYTSVKDHCTDFYALVTKSFDPENYDTYTLNNTSVEKVNPEYTILEIAYLTIDDKELKDEPTEVF